MLCLNVVVSESSHAVIDNPEAGLFDEHAVTIMHPLHNFWMLAPAMKPPAGRAEEILRDRGATRRDLLPCGSVERAGVRLVRHGSVARQDQITEKD